MVRGAMIRLYSILTVSWPVKSSAAQADARAFPAVALGGTLQLAALTSRLLRTALRSFGDDRES